MNPAQKAFLLAHLMAQDDASPSIQALTQPAALFPLHDHPPRIAIILVILRRGDEPACLIVLIFVAPRTGLLAADDPVNRMDPSGNFSLIELVVAVTVILVIFIGLIWWLTGPANITGVEIYVDRSALQYQGQADAFANGIFAYEDQIEAKFSTIRPTIIHDQALPDDFQPGYNKKTKKYYVSVVFNTIDFDVWNRDSIGYTPAAVVTLDHVALDDFISENTNPGLTAPQKKYIMANFFMHEVLHAILNRNYKYGSHHESSGLLKGFPATNSPITADEFKGGLLDFTDGTRGKLLRSVD